MKNRKMMIKFLCAAVLAGFLLVMAAPAIAYADDSLPAEDVQEAEPSEETVMASEPIAESEEGNADESAPAEEGSEAAQMDEAETAGEMENAAPQATDGNEGDHAQEIHTEEETLAEALAEFPQDTQIVVLDESGEELSLACEAAMVTMAASDPIWCPTGVMPGGAGCTAAVATMAELFPLLSDMSGAGTIFFTTSYNTNDVVLDQNANANLANLTSLTLQGGWNGSTTDPSILDEEGDPEHTEFSVPITINWNYDITLNDLYVQPNWDLRLEKAITITQNNPEADVTLDNVYGRNSEAGVMITGGYDVSITDSQFDANYGRGIDVRSVNGTFTLHRTHSSMNSETGLLLQTIKNVVIEDSAIYGNNLNRFNVYLGHFPNMIYDAENITITDSVFNDNDWYNLLIQYGEFGMWEFATTRQYTLDTLTINGSDFTNANNNGLTIDGWYAEGEDYFYTGTVDINALDTFWGKQYTIFSGNENNGLEISGLDVLDISGAEFTDNGDGLSTWLVDTINIADASFDENWNNGANITGVKEANFNGTKSKPISFFDNLGYGAMITNEYWYEDPEFSSTIKLYYVNGESNGDPGFSLTEFTEVTVDQCVFNQSEGNGFDLATRVPGNVTIKNTTFNNNTIGYGARLSLEAVVDVLFENNSAKENGVGVRIDTYGNVSYLCSPSENNLEYDLEVSADGILRLKGVDPEDEDYYENAYFYGGEDFIYLGACSASSSCCAVTGGRTTPPTGGRTVQIGGGEQVNLGCDVPWTSLVLPNRDRATFSGVCGAGMNASLNEAGQGDLPGALPAGMTFGKSLVTAIAGAGSELPAGSMTITFTVPDELVGMELAILFWDADAGAWVEISADSIIFNADGSISATVNFTGTFVLAGK